MQLNKTDTHNLKGLSYMYDLCFGITLQTNWNQKNPKTNGSVLFPITLTGIRDSDIGLTFSTLTKLG